MDCRPSDQGNGTTTPGEGTTTTTANGTAQTNQTTTGASGQSQANLWSMEEFVFEGSENGDINRFVLAFGRDQDCELYALGSNTGGVRGNGFVYKIVPPGEGELISTPTRTTTEEATQSGGAGEFGTKTPIETGYEIE